MRQSRRNEHIVISFISNCSYMWLIDNKNEMDRTMLTNSLIHDVIVGKKGLYYSMVTKQLGIQIDVEVNILRCGSIPVTDLFPPSLTSSQRFAIRAAVYRVFIKYCGVFFKDFRIFRTLVFLCFPSVSVDRQVEHKRCRWTGRVKKNHKILRKKHNI